MDFNFLYIFIVSILVGFFAERIAILASIHAEPESFNDFPKIVIKYFLLIFFTIFLLFSFEYYIQQDINLKFIFFSLFFSILIMIFYSDFKYYLIPDTLSYPLIWLGLCYQIQFGGFEGLSNAVYAIILGYMTLWIINQIHYLIKGFDGMGYGDFKLIAGFGAWFGIIGMINIVFISSIIALLLFKVIQVIKNDNKDYIPFGIPLVISSLFYHFYPLNPFDYFSKIF